MLGVTGGHIGKRTQILGKTSILWIHIHGPIIIHGSIFMDNISLKFTCATAPSPKQE